MLRWWQMSQQTTMSNNRSLHWLWTLLALKYRDHNLMEIPITLAKERPTKRGPKRMMSNQKKRGPRAKIKSSNLRMRNSPLTKRSRKRIRQKGKEAKAPMPNNLNRLLHKVSERTPPKRRRRPWDSQQSKSRTIIDPQAQLDCRAHYTKPLRKSTPCRCHRELTPTSMW